MNISTALTPKHIRDALRNLGAIGSANCAQRDLVTQEVCDVAGFRVDARTVRDVAHSTRSAEALKANPHGGILFNSRGMYLPSTRTTLAEAQDYRDCALFLRALVSDMPEQADALERTADTLDPPPLPLFQGGKAS
ncbi:hypothetical protein KQI63_05900 [bacterium]|nr:hypothetical protein [bacterium]